MSPILLKRPTAAAWEPIVNRAWQLGVVNAIQLIDRPGFESPTAPDTFLQGAQSGTHEISWTLHAQHTLFGAALLWDIRWRSRQATCGILIPGLANVVNPTDQLIPHQQLSAIEVVHHSLHSLARTAFEQLNLHRLTLYTDPYSPYIDVFGDVGFVHEGTLAQHRFEGGVFRDTQVFGILGRDLQPPPLFL
ncbi:MAG: GNAT family protein [Myxococcota bacterium]